MPRVVRIGIPDKVRRRIRLQAVTRFVCQLTDCDTHVGDVLSFGHQIELDRCHVIPPCDSRK